jgi:hypothetical protein
MASPSRLAGRCGGWRRRGSPPPAFRAWYLAFEARRNDHAPGWARQFLSSPSAGLCSCPNNERARPWMSSRVRIGGRPGGEASRSSSLATHQIRNGDQLEKTANSLGFAIPNTIQVLADEVIEYGRCCGREKASASGGGLPPLTLAQRSGPLRLR